MQEKLIDFDTAKLAKEKGLCNYFEDINPTNYVDAFYSEDGLQFEETEYMQEDCTIDDRYFRPTQGLLQKWLRDVHGIDFIIKPFYDSKTHKKTYVADAITPGLALVKIARQDSYEIALEIGLQEGLKLINEQYV